MSIAPTHTYSLTSQQHISTPHKPQATQRNNTHNATLNIGKTHNTNAFQYFKAQLQGIYGAY